jgi:Kdo2-lipid IVA lauroyltransferase/acyltransferase
LTELLIRIGVALLSWIARAPYPFVKTLGESSGSLAWWLAGRRRNIALTNLRLCLPELSESSRRRIAEQHFRYFMRSFFERFIFWFGSEQRIRSLVSFEGLELFEALRGQPVILLAPHFCGIDAGGIRLQLESPFASMYANQKSKVLTEVMTKGRTRFPGARMFLRNDGLRGAVRAMREGVPFYFLPDMDLGPRDAVFVPFFGVTAATVTSVERLARLTDARVLPLVTTMTSTGYIAKFFPPWQPSPDASLEACARQMNEFIEARVMEMPAQYLWTHKRFKTRPPGDASLYS